MNKNDTIAAIATAPGVGGIAVVRLSGDEALPIALRHLAVDHLRPRHATYCRFDELDDVVATYFPCGYTGEPTVELSCHGSLFVQQALLQCLLDDGARLADPGEYTMRAFLNGRLDLSQAEAVADLVDAVTPAQHRLAVSQLRGGYASRLKELRQQLLDLTALLELELDFSQEDVEFADRTQLRQLLSTLRSHLSSLIGSFQLGNALKQGVPVAITGSPNVGKSTLLNALLQDDRAIVSSIPGTTRDTVEGMLNIGGITFRLIDTAGLRESSDEVELQGIERSKKAVAEATVVVDVRDASLDADPLSGTDHHDGKQHIRVLNKCDLMPAVLSLDGRQCGDTRFVVLSAKTGMGVENLKQALVHSVDPHDADRVLLSNVRHRDALLRVDEALSHVSQGLDSDIPADLVAVDLRDALYHLGTITGDVTSDDLLHNIFSRFCIGK